ncbi:MAG: septum formation initiator family protein [Eubacteriales bacterium]
MRKRKKAESNIIDLGEAREKRRLKKELELNKKNKMVRKPKRIKEKRSKGEIIRNNRIRYFVFFCALFILVFLGISMVSIVDLKMQENKAAALQEQLKAEKTKLQHELTLINTPEYIEQQARMQLKMIKPGELLYVFPKVEEATGSEGTASPETLNGGDTVVKAN